MPSAARDDAAAGTGEALAVRRAEMDNLEARFGALMEDLAANPAFPGQDRRMTALIAAYRADRKALIDVLFAVELDETERERAYQRGLADGRASGRRTSRHAFAGARPGCYPGRDLIAIRPGLRPEAGPIPDIPIAPVIRLAGTQNR